MISIENALELRKICINDINDGIAEFIDIFAKELNDSKITCNESDVRSDCSIHLKPLSTIDKYIDSIEIRNSNPFEIYTVLTEGVFLHYDMLKRDPHLRLACWYKLNDKEEYFNSFKNITFLHVKINAKNKSNSIGYVVPFGMNERDACYSSQVRVIMLINDMMNARCFVDNAHAAICEKIENVLKTAIEKYTEPRLTIAKKEFEEYTGLQLDKEV